MITIKTKLCEFYILIAALVPSVVSAQRDIPTDNLSHPVLITLTDGSYGSGFIADDSQYVYLITAKHIFFKPPQNALISNTANLLKYSITDTSEGNFRFSLNLQGLLQENHLRYHKTHDIAIVYLAHKLRSEGGKSSIKFLNHVEIREKSNVSLIGVDISSFKRLSKVLIANEVIIFGFPRSLGIKELPQLDYDRPLLRKGIVAGINYKKNTIILDCPSYPGNSGGPVIEIDRMNFLEVQVKVIGIISQFVPFAENWVNLTQGYSNLEISNSGYSVVTPIEMVFELLSK